MRVQHLLVQALFSFPAVTQYTAEFQYPTGNETYNILDTVTVQWTSNYANPTLFTWVWDAVTDEGQQVSEISNVPQSGSFSYDLENYGSGLSVFPALLWFDLIYDLTIAGHKGGLNGHSFNVTSNAAAAPTTWVLGMKNAGSSPTTGASSTSTGISTTPETSAPAATSASRGGELSTGAKAGIGIGVTALVILTLAGIFGFIFSRRKIRHLEGQMTTVPLEYKHEMAADQKPQAYHQILSQELDAEGGYNNSVPTAKTAGGNGSTELSMHELPVQ